MDTIALFFLPLGLNSFDEMSKPNPVLFNEGWKTHLGDFKSVNEANEAAENRWSDVNLPYDWSVTFPISPSLVNATGYLPEGIGWYKKNTFTNESKRGEKVEHYGNIIHLTIQVNDENGIQVIVPDNEVTCTVTSFGRLLGLESGNSLDNGMSISNTRRRLNSDRLIAHIFAEKGEAPLKIFSPLPSYKKWNFN
jgi:hypothetical protein